MRGRGPLARGAWHSQHHGGSAGEGRLLVYCHELVVADECVVTDPSAEIRAEILRHPSCGGSVHTDHAGRRSRYLSEGALPQVQRHAGAHAHSFRPDRLPSVRSLRHGLEHSRSAPSVPALPNAAAHLLLSAT
jgi:hypothetical protein